MKRFETCYIWHGVVVKMTDSDLVPEEEAMEAVAATCKARHIQVFDTTRKTCIKAGTQKDNGRWLFTSAA